MIGFCEEAIDWAQWPRTSTRKRRWSSTSPSIPGWDTCKSRGGPKTAWTVCSSRKILEVERFPGANGVPECAVKIVSKADALRAEIHNL